MSNNGFTSISFMPADSGDIGGTPSAPTVNNGGAQPIANAGLQIGAQAPQRGLMSELEASMPPAASRVRVNTGGSYSASFSSEGASVSSNGVTSINMADATNGADGILSTAHRNGSPKPIGELRPTDFIKIGGMDVELRVAERSGFVTRDLHTGLYSNVSEPLIREATGEAPQERQRAAEVAQEEATKARAEAAKLPVAGAEEVVNDITANVTAGTQTRALLDVIESGTVNTRVLNMAASEAQIEPSEMGAKMGKALEGFTAQARSYAASQGVDLDHFGEWARQNHAGDLKRAMMAHYQGRDVGAYGELMGRYMGNLDKIAPDAILNATFPDPGVSAFKSTDGNIVLRIPGHGEVSWAAAVKAGLVAPRRG